jgi:hypothetical protein
MADDRKIRDHPVQRSFECHRLEEQLWSLAYQQLRPVIRRKTRASGAKTKQRFYGQSPISPQKARRA